MACYNPFGFLQTTGPRNARLRIHMYLHMPCLKMWKHITKGLIFKHLPSNLCQCKEDQLSDCQPQQTNWLPKMSSSVSAARLSLGFCFAEHTSKGFCPFQDFDTYFFIQPLNCRQKKRAFHKAHIICFYTAISATPICIPIFQKRGPSSAINQLLIEFQSKWD